MADLSYGEFDIEVNGEVYELRPTLKAMKKIQAKFGGLAGALQAIYAYNTESVAAIICAGASVGQREAEKVESDVFSHGVIEASLLVAPFVNALADPTGKNQEEESPKKAGKGKGNS